MMAIPHQQRTGEIKMHHMCHMDVREIWHRNLMVVSCALGAHLARGLECSCQVQPYEWFQYWNTSRLVWWIDEYSYELNMNTQKSDYSYSWWRPHLTIHIHDGDRTWLFIFMKEMNTSIHVYEFLFVLFECLLWRRFTAALRCFQRYLHYLVLVPPTSFPNFLSNAAAIDRPDTKRPMHSFEEAHRVARTFRKEDRPLPSYFN